MKRIFVYLLIVFGLMVGAMPVYIAWWHTEAIVLETQINAASSYSKAITQFRSYYSQEILPRINDLDIEITHDFRDRDHALPVPATMTFDLAARMNANDSRINIDIVSDYPFPWRFQKPLSPFEKRALTEFRQFGRNEYQEVVDFEGDKVLHYAVPMRMAAGCVACHNSHPDSPKTDWKIGDIRGLQIVSFPSDAVSSKHHLGLAYLTTFIIMTIIIGYSLIIWFYNRQQIAYSSLNNKTTELDFVKQALDEHAIVAMFDANRHVIYANQQLAQISGYSVEELIGQDETFFIPELDDYDFLQYEEMWEMVESGKIWHGDFRSRNKAGDDYWVSATIVPLINAEGEVFRYISIQTDITTRILAERESVLAREAAEKANLAKSEFLSSMSHELRTPLNAILGFSELIEYDSNLPQEHLESAKEISQAGNHLLSLINDILDLSKIESGKLEMNFSTVAVTDLAAECTSLMETLAQKYEIHLINKISSNLGVRADYLRLKQVILNLMSNAVKYNQNEGSVTLRAEKTPDGASVRIFVEDTGIGISQENLQKLFEPFTRLAEHQMTVEGTGIGLTITRKMVEMMNGVIGYDSTVGKGSSFWIELPYEHPAPKAEKKSLQDISSLNIDRQFKVLYIEDNPANTRLVEKTLKPIPHVTLVTADTPQEGIKVASKEVPDLILLDINLPGMSGYQVLNVLRMNKKFKTTPIFAVTANAMPKDIERGKEAGFDEYLTKPLNIKNFISLLDEYLLADYQDE